MEHNLIIMSITVYITLLRIQFYSNSKPHKHSHQKSPPKGAKIFQKMHFVTYRVVQRKLARKCLLVKMAISKCYITYMDILNWKCVFTVQNDEIRFDNDLGNTVESDGKRIHFNDSRWIHFPFKPSRIIDWSKMLWPKTYFSIFTG